MTDHAAGSAQFRMNLPRVTPVGLALGALVVGSLLTVHLVKENRFSTETSTVAPTTQSTASSRSQAVTLLKRLSGYDATQVFEGPGGMIGLIYDAGANNQQVVWASPEGDHIIMGPMLDAEGRNLTGHYTQQANALATGITAHPSAHDEAPAPVQTAQVAPAAAPDPIVEVAADQVEALRALSIVTSGTGEREVFLLADPNCPHCRNSYLSSLNKDVQEGLTVHWLMTDAIGGDDSASLVADLVSGKSDLLETMSASASTAPRPAADEKTKAYLSKTWGVLENVVKTPSVPAVIFEENGHWKARIGFNPREFLPTNRTAS